MTAARARISLANLRAQNAALDAQLEAAALRVVRSGRYILGEEVAALEREISASSRVAHAVGMSSGSDALVAILAACGIGAGDEVITTPLSFFATAEAIVRVGARPVFADIDAATLNIDLATARARIGPRTKAILVVHLFGRMVDTAPIADAGVHVIEDAAQAIGAALPDGRGPGAVGAGAALSFFPAKNLGAMGDAGMVLTEDAQLAERVRAIRVHGARAAHVHETIGGNFRLDEIQAAVLRVKLARLDEFNAARRRVAQRYRQKLKGVQPPVEDARGTHVYHQFTVRSDRRDAIREALARDGIAASIFYPTPLHRQPAYEAANRGASLPQSEAAAKAVLSLPIHPLLDDASVDRICARVEAALA